MSESFSFGDLKTHLQKRKAGTPHEEPDWVKDTPEEAIERAAHEHLMLPVKKPFDDYYHPSQLYDMCPVAEFWLRIRRPAFLVEEPRMPLSMMAHAGTQAHNFFHNEVLGPAPVLWGTWECTKCGAEMEKTFLPDQCQCSDCRCTRLQYVEPSVLSHEHKIRGHSDGYIRIDGFEDALLEMKSKSAETWKKTNAPNKRERIQGSLYMHFLDVPRCVYFFICRDTYQYKPIIEEKKEDLVDQVLGTIDAIERCVAAGEVDPILTCQKKCSSMKTTRARECPFRNDCWGKE